MTRGQLPQRAGSLGLNGGGTAVDVTCVSTVEVRVATVSTTDIAFWPRRGCTAYGHLEADASSVAHSSPAVGDSSYSILDADKPNRHFHVHGHVHGRMSDHVLVDDCSKRPALVKVEAWRVEPAPVGFEKLPGLESIERHDLASSNVHDWTLTHDSPLHLGVVES